MYNPSLVVDALFAPLAHPLVTHMGRIRHYRRVFVQMKKLDTPKTSQVLAISFVFQHAVLKNLPSSIHPVSEVFHHVALLALFGFEHSVAHLAYFT